MRITPHVVLAALLCPVPALAQEQGPLLRLELRVVSVSAGGSLVIDRGKRDGLLAGDLVTFRTPAGEQHRGTVTEVEDRSARVELRDRTVQLAAGTRGEVMVPRTRLDRPPDPKPPDPKPTDPRPPTPEPQDPARPVVTDPDPEWQPGMPLLAGGRPQRPEQRPTRLVGRLFAAAELTMIPGTDFTNSFMRTGTDAEIENPFGSGGGLHLDTEFDYRTERNEEQGFDLLVRRLSYHHGGDRFTPSRIEVGRFLHRGMPEFGVLDGVEWGRRLEGGSRVGVSLGFLPEPDDDFDSGDDLQFAGYYRWVADAAESLALSLGFQKSWHQGNDDRDLLVLKAERYALDGWDLSGTAWIDFYFSDDPIKGTGVEITQALVYAGRHFDNGNGLDFSYRRIRYPDIQRREFRFLPANQIADERYDRVATNWWWWSGVTARWHGHGSYYNDETNDGGAAELGLEMLGAMGDGTRLDLTAFGSLGQFTQTIGGRLILGRTTTDGRWELLYEASTNQFDDRPSNGDDLLQHRLALSRDFYTASGWSFSLLGEAFMFDDDFAFTVGILLNKSF